MEQDARLQPYSSAISVNTCYSVRVPCCTRDNGVLAAQAAAHLLCALLRVTVLRGQSIMKARDHLPRLTSQ